MVPISHGTDVSKWDKPAPEGKKMDFVTLNNGVKMPMLGFGTYQISREDCERCVREALDVGYRHIDTAQAYFNETEVGKAVRESGIPREEIFVTSKIWVTNHGYEKAKASVEHSLKIMGLDYLDLMLVHQPFADYYGAYRALVELQAEGKVRAIGVSNFYPRLLADLVAFNDVKPQINQVEVNPFCQQEELHKLMDKLHVQIEAWSPFVQGQHDIFKQPVLQQIGAKYGKSVSQVILRYLMQRNVVALAKTTHKERMAENFAIFDFALDQGDLDAIAALDTKKNALFDHSTVEAVDMFKDFSKLLGDQLV